MANDGSTPTGSSSTQPITVEVQGPCDPEGGGPLLGGEARIEAGGMGTSVITAS